MRRLRAPAQMNHVHLIGGEKGGVGISVMSGDFAEHCIDWGIPFQGIDSDPSHRSFMRFYQDFAADVELDARIIELPKPHEGSMHQVGHSNSSFRAQSMPLKTLISCSGSSIRQRVKVWLRNVYLELDSLGLSRTSGLY